jgi:hypothetical protein
MLHCQLDGMILVLLLMKIVVMKKYKYLTKDLTLITNLFIFQLKKGKDMLEQITMYLINTMLFVNRYQHLLSSGMVDVKTMQISKMNYHQELILLKAVTYYAIKQIGVNTFFFQIMVNVYSMYQDALMQVVIGNTINLLMLS